MKKLPLILLVSFSAQAFAQKNELVLSPGIVYYKGYTSNHPKTNYIGNLEGGGWRLAASYFRNIIWLQFGGSLEVGRLGYNETEGRWIPPNPDQAPVKMIDRESVGDPFITAALQANAHYPIRKLTVYAGVSGGYFASTARHSTNYGGWPGYDAEYPLDGPMVGGQTGAALKLLPGFSLSADFSYRFVNMNRFPRIRLPGPGYNSMTFYDKLSMYNFGLGIRYRF